VPPVATDIKIQKGCTPDLHEAKCTRESGVRFKNESGQTATVTWGVKGNPFDAAPAPNPPTQLSVGQHLTLQPAVKPSGAYDYTLACGGGLGMDPVIIIDP
jgi:hypothetical protein